MGALAGMCAHIHRDHEAGDAVRLFLQAFREAGYGITLTQERDRHHPVATLDPEGRLRICDETAFAALHFGRGMLQSLAAGELAKLAPDACPIPYLREAITPGQQPSRIR